MYQIDCEFRDLLGVIGFPLDVDALLAEQGRIERDALAGLVDGRNVGLQRAVARIAIARGQKMLQLLGT